jgi:transcriptional regulator with XRE-family HTH domain
MWSSSAVALSVSCGFEEVELVAGPFLASSPRLGVSGWFRFSGHFVELGAHQLFEGSAWHPEYMTEIDHRESRLAAGGTPLLGHGIGLGTPDPQQSTRLLHSQQRRQSSHLDTISLQCSHVPRIVAGRLCLGNDLTIRRTCRIHEEMARHRKQDDPIPEPTPEVNLNQVVAYNFRAARELRGWTQEDTADRLEPYLGMRLTQASISAIERAWDGDRHREFDAHEILAFALGFDLPLIWFYMPPPDDRRHLERAHKRINELYEIVLGTPDQLEPLLQRLRELGVRDPTERERLMEAITGEKPPTRTTYQERRKQAITAFLDDYSDNLDHLADEYGRFFDHLRAVGIRGFVAEHTGDEDFTFPPEARAKLKELKSRHEPTSEDSNEDHESAEDTG